MVRASVEASAAREEGAEQRQRRRRPRLHRGSLAPQCGARQRRSQRSPRRASQGDSRGAAARDCTGAASHHTVVRASVGAGAARDERAEQRPRRRRPRLH
eukprot:scaffold89499_cov66-Phaeocystis_antarctica.AAC.1